MQGCAGIYLNYWASYWWGTFQSFLLFFQCFFPVTLPGLHPNCSDSVGLTQILQRCIMRCGDRKQGQSCYSHSNLQMHIRWLKFLVYLFLSLFEKDLQVLTLTTILPGVSKDYAFLKFSVFSLLSVQSALNFQLDLKCGVTFNSRKVTWEIVKHCMLWKTVPVHSCSSWRGAYVCWVYFFKLEDSVFSYCISYGLQYETSFLTFEVWTAWVLTGSRSLRNWKVFSAKAKTEANLQWTI